MRRPDFKLALGVAAVLVALCVVCAGVMAVAARRHFDELTQRLNASIAMYVDREATLLHGGNPDHERLREISRHAMVVNPLARVYLLDLEGNVISGGEGRVRLGPLLQRLAGRRGPVYGDDPAHPGGRSVFSVHPVSGGGGYVYVVLGGAQVVGATTLIASSHILMIALLLLMSVMVAAGAIAVAFDRRMRRARANIAALRGLDQERRRLFESIGHDLRTPLSAVCGYLEVLERDGQLSSEAGRQYLSIVSAHCSRLARLVSQIFRLARLESPDVEAVREPVSISDLAQDIGGRFECDATRGLSRVYLDIDQTVPPVLADCELLETAIENLLDNAIRHGGSSAVARLSVAMAGDMVLVSIHDTGSGVGPEALRGMLEQVPGRRGLGLIIVRRALDLLGSRLEVRSVPGSGTTMSFRLAVMNP